ncbi:hypothetical protein [uncultured Oscillibacter sp.]|uniref:hypothetical protein n=1 Tax=uncultured Oscillibacter sp. TaxID=876091 RepID=UPI0025F7CBE2|nr:hypothetical protein [uncultured Oscillibacter sp.]
MIQEQETINSEVSQAVSKVAYSFFIFGCNNKWLEALLMVLKEGVNDKYDYIKWWLYDATENYKVQENDESKEWCLKEPEVLYDFIITECQDWGSITD